MNNELQIDRMRRFFQTDATRTTAFRKEQLNKLADALNDFEERIHQALYADLRKSPTDAYTSETGYVQSDIRHAIKNLDRWNKPQHVSAPLLVKPAKGRIVPEPKGIVLIIGPWNYPAQLVLSPLVAAIAAGNCVVLKPSELTPGTSAVLHELIAKTFDPDFIRLVEGERETAEALLDQPFDHIFFTGGTETGRAVAQAAAKQLIPVTLELGGKNPAVVCRNADLKTAVRRIVRGKFMNAGQLCVAPDHVWIPTEQLEPFCDDLTKTIRQFYGDNPQQSSDYGRIVNRNHFERLTAMYPDCKADADDLYIAPTVIPSPPLDSALMQEEIFGPLLPVIPYEREEEIITFCQSRSTPLALYLFSSSESEQQQLRQAIPSGGICINDTVMQIIPKNLPFGGKGASGIGAYHGQRGFDEFSHFRSVLTRSVRFDPRSAYPPLNVPLKWLKRFYRFFA